MRMAFGFSTAAALLDATNLAHGEHDESRVGGSIAQQKRSNKRKHQQETEQEASDLLEPRDFETITTMVGWKYYKHLHGSDIPSQGTNSVLEREPDNEYDANGRAITVMHLCSHSHQDWTHFQGPSSAPYISFQFWCH